MAGVFVACSDFTPPGPAGTAALVVNPKTAHINVGSTLQLIARGASSGVVWSSSDESVATVSLGKVTGVGSGSATIRAVSGTNQGSARITVTRAAAIALSTSSISFSGVPGASPPDSQTVNVTDAGEDSLTGLTVADVSYGSGATGWLSARLTQTDAPATLVLRPNTTALAPGSYTATVTIAGSVTTGTQQVTVTFTLLRPAVITLANSSAGFTAQQNAPIPSQQSIEITNTGEAPLTGLAVGSIAYSSGASGWLGASLSQTSAPAFLVLQVNTTGLAPGSYSATVPVTSTAPGVAPASVTVTYTITAAPQPPTISVSPTSLTISAGKDYPTLPSAEQVAVSSTGTGVVNGLSASSITYGPGASNWLSTSFSGNVTTAPTTLDVQANTTGLAAGVYTATIHLSSTTTGVATKDIPVTYVVNDFVLDQTSIQFYTKSGTSPAAQVVNVSNAGSGSISGVTATVTLLSGPAASAYQWLQTSIGGPVPQAPSTTALTLTITRADSLGTFTAAVTVSAPGMVSKTVNVTFLRQATMAGDIFPILHDSTFGTGTGKCAGCHSALTAADSSIDFSSSDQAFGSLVTPTFNGKTYFTPGADSSTNYFLYQILNGTAAASGAPNMPTSCQNGNTACMHAGLRTRIYIWILQGALKQ